MNLRSYDAIATRWDSVRTTLSEKEACFLTVFADALPPASRVLDLGCGTGRPIAERLVALGHGVLGVDGSEAMLAFARARMPEQTWLRAPLETFIPPGSFGGVVAWDSLFHLPRALHATIFTRVRAAVSAGSPFALTVGGSDHAAFTDTMFDRPFFYDSHPPGTAERLLESAGFAVTTHGFLNLPTTGRDKGRHAIVARAV